MPIFLVVALWFSDRHPVEPDPPPEVMPLALITIVLVVAWIGVLWLTKRSGDRKESTTQAKGPDPRSESWWGG